MDYDEFMLTRKTELLCPYKCQGMSFLIYTDKTVKCRTCKEIVDIDELISEYWIKLQLKIVKIILKLIAIRFKSNSLV